MSLTVNLFAQPGPSDNHTFININENSKPFLHCVTDEKYFAKYAIEAHSGFFELMKPIKCKLHIPTGINKIWQDVENSHLHNKGEYDYSKDFWVGIRFNFYVGGVMVSTAFKNFEKPQKDTSSFTFCFDLNPLDFEQGEGAINFAYIQFLKSLKKSGSHLGIEVALSSKNSNHKSYVPIAFKSFYLRYDAVKYGKWMESATDYNIQLKQLADSTMKSVFGEIGFSKNFTMSCLQNPCSKGYQYDNTLVSNNPCASEPQDSCKEAIVTYNFVKKDVPLTIKMLITINENGQKVYIENNPYGSKQISIEKQNLLSIPELQKIINKKFPNDSLAILANNKSLVYSHTRIKQPGANDKGKMNSHPRYKVLKETRFGKNWEGGFIYAAISLDQKKSQIIYHFDAVTGKLLRIFKTYAVTNINHNL